MNFSFQFYQKMKSELSEKSYLKAFEIAKYLEWHPAKEWREIIHTACNNPDYIEGCGVSVEAWFNRNLLWR